MSQQLRRGAGQVLGDVDQRLKRILSATDDPAIQSDIVDLRVIIQDEVKPMLMRAGPAEPTQDARIRALEEKDRAKDAKINDMAGMLSTIMQMLGQTL